MHKLTPLLLGALSALTVSAYSSVSRSTSRPLPLIIWHGLGDNYQSDGMKDIATFAEEIIPGTFTYAIRLNEDPSSDRSASFFGNVTMQLEAVCDAIASHPILSTAPAVNALGFSQGGQFLRGYVERCNNPPVRNLVTFGSQHNGIADFQACGATDWVCKGAMALLKTNTWSAFVQSRLVPAQYYRTTDPATGAPSDEYLEHSNFLADINNERERKNKHYARNIAKLSSFVMYVFANDTTVIPKESGWFAQTNMTDGTVTPLRERELYQQDWLGLKELDEKGGLEFRQIDGGHMRLTEEVLEEAFKTYFGPVDVEDDEELVTSEWEDKADL